jgi:hypothetical protein
MRLTLSAEIDCQNAKACRRQRPRLWGPAIFLETSTVSQHYCSVSFSIHVGIDHSAILCWKGNALLRDGETGERKKDPGFS